MKTLCLTFHNGATRTLEAASYAKARCGVVIMTPGGNIVRFNREELSQVEELAGEPQSKPRFITFKRAHSGPGKVGTPAVA